MTLNVHPLQPFELVGQKDLGNVFLESLSQLYLPIIGPVSMSLYTLLMTIPKPANADPRVALRHKILLAQLNVGTGELNEARRRLEAVGLLKTYRDMKSNTDPKNQVIHYHLNLPVQAEDFFQDPLLSQALLKKTSELEYQELAAYFPLEEMDEDRLTEESESFQKIFSKLEVEEQPVQVVEQEEEFDLTPGLEYNRFLEYILSEGINHQELTQELKRQVYAIYNVYGNSESELANLVYSAYDKTKGKVDFDFLKKLADRHHRSEQTSWQIPTAVPSNKHEETIDTDRTSQMFTAEESKMRREQIKTQYPNVSEEDIQLVLSCEQMPSNMFLNKTKEAKKTFATDSEHYYVRELGKKSRLNEHVINFLIYYLLIINHRPNIYKGELERTASEWEQEDLTNVPKAIQYIRLQRKKKDVQNKQKNNQTNYKRRGKSQHKEIIPSWMQENQSSVQQPQTETPADAKDVQENEAELRRRLNELIGGEGEN